MEELYAHRARSSCVPRKPFRPYVGEGFGICRGGHDFGIGRRSPSHPEKSGGEANLKLPDLSSVSFLNNAIDGHKLLLIGILFCIFGLGFGLVIYTRLKNLPVHRAMREISELIYETCKTYLVTQGKFLLLLWVFIAVIILLYFGVLLKLEAMRVAIILLFSIVGIAGSYGVAWFGIRVNTFANSRTAFAGSGGQALSDLQHSAASGHEHRHDADQRRVADHAVHSAVCAGRLRWPMLYRLRHRRIAGRGGVANRGRHLHQDRRHRVGL